MEEIVQGTNDSSILSKYSMITSGYDEDSYIKYFVHKKVKRAPLINLGYFVRSIIMTDVINYFCKISSKLPDVQIVSLGAGFDTTFFKTVSDYRNIRYFEIDLLGVVKRKIEIIAKNDILKEKITHSTNNMTIGDQNEFLSSNNYCIFSHDLNYLDGLDMKLRNYHFNYTLPTLIFSECAITYLEEQKSTNLICWLQNHIPKATFLIFEQINPDDAFGRVMISHFNKIQSPIKSVQIYKTLGAQIQRYLSCGWNWCRGVSALQMLYSLRSASSLWNTLKREPFDEFEEWHLKCCHYALIIASNAENSSLWNTYLPNITSQNSYIEFQTYSWKEIPNMVVERFGHSCSLITETDCLIIGGFGNEDKKHSRISTVLHLSFENFSVRTMDILNVENESKPVWNCMYSTCTKISHDKFIIYGGRASPLKPVNSKPWICLLNWMEEDKVGNILPVLQGPTSTGEQEPSPRWRHSAVLIKPNKILIFGGLTIGLKVLGDLWELIISVDSNGKNSIHWNELHTTDSEAPPSCFSHSAAVENETMYISGGLNDNILPLDHLWTYHTLVGWKKIKTVPSLNPRYGHTSHITPDRKLLLLGGVNINERNQPGLTIICLKSFVVTDYSLMPTELEYPTLMLHNHSSIYQNKENSLYIIGGGGNCFSFGTYLNHYVVHLKI
ncbi:hypothetical protein O3M35_005125 [Rhynocoris fuscipes]|uniref:tRNA wybutosine-synthesizing protein 4 n=1 Tax=Rhynocoris fuscipes TaxID=488301 RepID=A0AAW1DH57_9HEMI